MAKTKRTKPTLAEVRRAQRIKDDDVKAKLELFERAQKTKDPKRKKTLVDKLNKLHRAESSMPRGNINKTSKSNRLKNLPSKIEQFKKNKPKRLPKKAK